MSKIKARSFDRNRYGKKYPVVRSPKRLSFMGDADMEIEVLTVTFTNQEEKEVVFEKEYIDTNFRILVSARDTTSGDSAQVALAIDEAQTTTSKTKIEASAPFTGKVDVIVIRIA